MAAEFGSLAVLKVLLDHGAKKDAKDGVRRAAPPTPPSRAQLPRSACPRRARAVRRRTARGSSALQRLLTRRARAQSGNTMVHKAAKAGKEEMLKYLLEELKLDANAVTTVRTGRRSGRVSR